MSLQQKRIVIVGGSSGIGNTVAHQCVKKGASVVIAGRNATRLTAAVESLKLSGADVRGEILDVRDAESLDRFTESLEQVDHLVSTVGGAMGGGFATADFATIREAIENKFFDNLKLARAILPKINANGSMVFTSGTGGRPHTASGAYVGNISVQAMVEGLASELAPKIRVNAVAPTWTETPLWRDVPVEQREATKQFFNNLIPLGRTATLGELASAYVFLMENGFITGQQLAVDGGVMLRV